MPRWPFEGMTAVVLAAGAMLSVAAAQPVDLIAEDGMELYGYHRNLRRFVVPEGATVKVRDYHPDEPGTGILFVYAEEIEIAGTLTAEAAGYTGGGGGAGEGGKGSHPQPPGSDGQDGLPGKGRYPGFDGGVDGIIWWESVGDGPAAGQRSGYLPDREPRHGGYDVQGGNDDATTNTRVWMGSGGAGAFGMPGGRAGESPAPLQDVSGGDGGSGGGPGGGAISLNATRSLIVSGTIITKGGIGGIRSLGEGSWCSYAPHVGVTCQGGNGGRGGNGYGGFDPGIGHEAYGAGGGVLLLCEDEEGLVLTGTVDARGGLRRLENGGTIKIFHTGDLPTSGTLHSPRIYMRDLAQEPLELGTAFILSDAREFLGPSGTRVPKAWDAFYGREDEEMERAIASARPLEEE